MARPTVARLPVLVATLVMGATVACSSDGSSDAASRSDLTWEDDGDRAQRAVLEVPVDYDVPDGETLTLSIARVPAQGDRIGALFVNPGGPGTLASHFAVNQLAAALPAEITDRFDIVGMDPRGLGSSAIDCGADLAELYGVDPTIDSPDDEAALIDTSQRYVDACHAAAGDLLSHLGTRNVARDMDAVREAMGDDQISYLGYSYGTVIGQIYAHLFPDRVRAMVLDGAVEPGQPGTETVAQQAQGFERALSAFADDCNPQSSCPLAPDALGAIRELIERAEAAPIPAAPRDLGPGELALGMSMALYSDTLWDAFAGSVGDALDGDGSRMVTLANQYLGSLTNFDVYFAVSCLDFVWPEDPEQLLDFGATTGDVAPYYGEALVNDYVRCSMWPTPSDPLPEVTAQGTPPILVVAVTNDPATPYEAGVAVAKQLESGVLLTYEGDGHGVVGTNAGCVDDVAARYLVDLEPPADGTTC